MSESVKDRLIGKDASLERVTFGTEMTTGSLVSGKFYKITGKASTASIFGDLEVGEIFYAGSASLALGTGDKCLPLTETPFLDSTGWEMNITAKEIDVTLASDEFDKFRKGKKSVDGSVSGLITQGQTLAPGGLLNRFIKLVQFKSGTVVINQIDESPIFIKGLIQKDMAAGNVYAYIFAQIELYNIKLGGKGDAAQDYDSKLKLAGADPVFYTVEVAA